jgi:hypothetical protein
MCLYGFVYKYTYNRMDFERKWFAFVRFVLDFKIQMTK